MATARLYNLARMTTATTGTGTVTLGSAVTGFLTFAQSGVANGATVSYAIKDGNNSEIGRGVYTASGTTLTRATVLNSTNSNNALNLTGSAEVFITPAGLDYLPNINAQTGTTYTVLATDLGKLVSHSNAASIAVTLPQATGLFGVNWFYYTVNLGAGTVTITPTTSTINGGATLVLRTGAGAFIVSDGTNYTAIAIQGADVDTAKLDVVQTFSAAQTFGSTVTASRRVTATPFALTSAAAWAGADYINLTVNVNGGAFTIANPTSSTAGTYYNVFVTYTTSHSISWGANFKGVSTVTPTATAGAYDHFSFRSNGTNLMLTGYNLNIGV
jgi:hypothetical protein